MLDLCKKRKKWKILELESGKIEVFEIKNAKK
jgi:hypothetical protein